MSMRQTHEGLEVPVGAATLVVPLLELDQLRHLAHQTAELWGGLNDKPADQVPGGVLEFAVISSTLCEKYPNLRPQFLLMNLDRATMHEIWEELWAWADFAAIPVDAPVQ
jgi:hypothetical protein